MLSFIQIKKAVSARSEDGVVDYREFLKMKRGKRKQKDFAKELGVSWEYYSKVERGQQSPSFTWLENIAAKLDASLVVELVGKDNLQDKTNSEVEK